jgi:hypothetical protein
VESGERYVGEWEDGKPKWVQCLGDGLEETSKLSEDTKAKVDAALEVCTNCYFSVAALGVSQGVLEKSANQELVREWIRMSLSSFEHFAHLVHMRASVFAAHRPFPSDNDRSSNVGICQSSAIRELAHSNPCSCQERGKQTGCPPVSTKSKSVSQPEHAMFRLQRRRGRLLTRAVSWLRSIGTLSAKHKA